MYKRPINTPFINAPFINAPFINTPFINTPFMSAPFLSNPLIGNQRETATNGKRQPTGNGKPQNIVPTSG
jgi:hypothetical protein